MSKLCSLPKQQKHININYFAILICFSYIGVIMTTVFLKEIQMIVSLLALALLLYPVQENLEKQFLQWHLWSFVDAWLELPLISIQLGCIPTLTLMTFVNYSILNFNSKVNYCIREGKEIIIYWSLMNLLLFYMRK